MISRAVCINNGVFVCLVSLLTCQLLQARHLVTTGSKIYQHPTDLPETQPGSRFHAVSSNNTMFASRVLHWHLLYCGKDRVCKDHMTTNCFRCSPCQCDINCTLFQDCCPDVAMETDRNEISVSLTSNETNVMSCEMTELLDVEYDEQKDDEKTRRESVRRAGHFSHSYFMVSRCPPTFSGDAQQCHNNGALSPVTAAGSGSTLTFRNAHCARCHQVLDTTPWNVHISCQVTTNLKSVHTPREIIMMSLSQSDCSVSYVPPSQSQPRQCHSRPAIISTCNVTGKWTKRDFFLERACHNYLTPKLVEDVLYKNVFCFMCNHDDEPATQMLLTSCQKELQRPDSALELTIRHLDVATVEEASPRFGSVPYKLCGRQGIYDSHEKSCREVKCETGQHLVLGTCQPMFLTARGLAYEVYFAVRSRKPIDLSDDYDFLHHLPPEIEVYLGQTLLRRKVKLQYFAMSFNTTGQDGRCGQVSSDLGVYARLVAQTLMEQRQLQNDLLKLRQTTFNIQTRGWSMLFQSFPSETAWHIMHPSRQPSPQMLSACIIIVSNSHQEEKKGDTLSVDTSRSGPQVAGETEKVAYIRVSSLLTCPHLRLLPHEYSLAGPGSDLILHSGNIVLPSNKYLMDLNDSVTICISDFSHKLGSSRSRHFVMEEVAVIVLLVVSLLCLLGCLIMFLTFSVLRSFSGQIDMVFIICLFCSQTTLLIGHLVDDRSKTCSVVGVLSHYFTICVFCSLMVCSYQIYVTFTTMHQSAGVTRDQSSIVLYCCFIFLMPLSIIGAVVGVHISRDVTWHTFGYGGTHACLLSSILSTWLAFFVPVVAFMVINLILFGMTSCNIHRNKDVETNTANERLASLYLRVSLLTSVTWIIGMTETFTSFDPLRITFFVMQCLLGLYVFMSLILAPGVTRLFSGTRCQSRHPQRGKTSQNLKTESSKECPGKPSCSIGMGYRKRDLNMIHANIRRQPAERYTKRNEFMESVE